jgi:hypothetical protein
LAPQAPPVDRREQEMPFRTTLILALALLGLVAYLFLVEFPNQGMQQESQLQAKRVFRFNPEEVTSFTLEYPDIRIRLARSEDRSWKMIEPLSTATEDREVEGLLATAAEMEEIRLVAEHDENPEAFGFTSPPLKIQLDLGDRQEEVILGHDGPITDTLFVKQGSTQRVALTRQWIKGSLSRTIFDLREKSIWSVDSASVQSIRLEMPGGPFLFLREGDRWMIRDPVIVPADSAGIDALLGRLVHLKATGFVDGAPQIEETRQQFQEPGFRAILAWEGGQAEASIFRTGEGRPTYAVTLLTAPLYQISESLLDDFKSEVFHYQDKHMVKFNPEEIAGIEIRGPDESFTLEKKNDGWIIENEAAPIDAESITRFLEHLSQLEAEKKPGEVISLLKAGLNPPQWKIVLTPTGGGPVALLTIGQKESENFLYAAGLPDLGTVLIRHDFLDNLPRKAEILDREAPAMFDGG